MLAPRIFVVDDDPGWRNELSDILNAAGFSVEVANSKDVALDEIIKSDYAVIVIDLHLGGERMGEQDFAGFDLLEGLQFLDTISFSRSKAIVLSAYGDIEQIRQAFKRGAYDFIEKQKFQSDEFLKVVRDAVAVWGSEKVERKELTESELKEYRRISRQFMRGEAIHFSVPDDARNPWSKEDQE